MYLKFFLLLMVASSSCFCSTQDSFFTYRPEKTQKGDDKKQQPPFQAFYSRYQKKADSVPASETPDSRRADIYFPQRKNEQKSQIPSSDSSFTQRAGKVQTVEFTPSLKPSVIYGHNDTDKAISTANPAEKEPLLGDSPTILNGQIIIQLREEKAVLQDKIQEYSREIEQLRKNLEDAQKQATEMSVKNIELEAENSHLERYLRGSQDQVAELKKELSRLQFGSKPGWVGPDELKETISRQSVQIGELINRLQRLEADKQQTTFYYQQQLVTLQGQISNLTGQLQVRDLTIQQMIAEKSAKEHEILKLQQQLDTERKDFQKRLAEIGEKCVQLEKEKQDQIAQAENAGLKLQNENAELHQRIQELIRENEELEQRLAESSEEEDSPDQYTSDDESLSPLTKQFLIDEIEKIRQYKDGKIE